MFSLSIMRYFPLVRESSVTLDLLLILLFSEIVDSLQATRPDRVSHQIYLEACDKYSYPSRPQVSCLYIPVWLRPGYKIRQVSS